MWLTDVLYRVSYMRLRMAPYRSRHTSSCFFSSWVAAYRPACRRRAAQNSQLCVHWLSNTLLKVGHRLECTSNWLKEMPCCLCRHRKQCWGKTLLSSSTFTPAEGLFYHMLRSIWCFTGCNGKQSSSNLWGHLCNFLHIYTSSHWLYFLKWSDNHSSRHLFLSFRKCDNYFSCILFLIDS